MKKQHSIRNKITILLLFSVLAVLVANSLLAIWNLRTMKGVFGKQSMDLGQMAAEDAEKTMENMAGEHLLGTSIEKASFIEEKFGIILADVQGITQTAEKIYENPEEYPDRAVAPPIKGSRKLAAQLLWSKQLAHPTRDEPALPSPNEEQLTEIKKLGNIQDILVQCNANNDMISSVYIATRTGWMIQADYIAYRKYSKDKDIPDYYEAEQRQWFIRARQSKPGEIVYSDVIADVHEGKDCIVCAQPVYANGEVVAVVGVGSYLDAIHEAVLDTTIGDTGYAFLVNEKGQIMVSGAAGGETAVSQGTVIDLRNSTNAELAETAEAMVRGESRLVKLTIDGKKVYLAYAPLTALGWSFVTVMDVEEVIAPALESQSTILALADSVSSQVDTSIRHVFMEFVIIAFATFAVVGIISISFGKKITEPIQRLTEEVAATNGGNLDGCIRICTGDEVEQLGDAFNRMRMQLKIYIENLSRITAEKERIHAELSVATDIQADMLPDSRSMLSKREEYSLYAAAYPAKEVGGDFYDFFLIDRDHLAFIVADVSGKGVPAALFMVMGKTLIENQLMLGKTPAETFERVNNALCRNNRNGMFLTAWLGVLELSTGHLEYVNAGHNSPLWYSAKEKTYTRLTEISGFVLAGMENTKYSQKEIELHQGDKLFVYSDGVTEANDETGKMYGDSKLEKFLNCCADDTPEDICMKLKSELQRFKGNGEQFDDITMLSLAYYGVTDKHSCTSLPDQNGLVQTAEMVTEYLEAQKVNKRDINKMLMVLDEIYSNICNHSNASVVTVRCNADKEKMTLEFEDDGIPFNFLDTKVPRIDEAIENRKLGGLGIHMVRSMMDDVNYCRGDGRNHLILTSVRNSQGERA